MSLCPFDLSLFSFGMSFHLYSLLSCRSPLRTPGQLAQECHLSLPPISPQEHKHLFYPSSFSSILGDLNSGLQTCTAKTFSPIKPSPQPFSSFLLLSCSKECRNKQMLVLAQLDLGKALACLHFLLDCKSEKMDLIQTVCQGPAGARHMVRKYEAY